MFQCQHRFLRPLCATILLALALSTSISAQDTAKRGRKYKVPPPTSHVEVTVVRATTGKPVENASVIFHPIVNGHDSGNMELKTNDEGKAILDLLEIGSDVRVQVLATGFQTFGQDFKIDKDQLAIDVKLKRPTEQYSIYKKSEGNAPDKNADKNKAPDAPKDAAKPDAPKPDAPKL
jgi:hypothetical protein